jgi:uncharacterized protein (DUF427 family)
MSERTRLDPGPEHTITVAPTGHRMTATVEGQQVAVSEHTLTLREAGTHRWSTSPLLMSTRTCYV